MNIIIYTTLEICPNCNALKKYLDKKGLEYTEIDMTTPEAITTLRVNNRFDTQAPILQADNEFMGVGMLFFNNQINKLIVDEFLLIKLMFEIGYNKHR